MKELRSQQITPDNIDSATQDTNSILHTDPHLDDKQNSQTSEEKEQQDNNSENTGQKESYDVEDPLGLLESKHIAAAAAYASHACNNEKSRKRKYQSEEERLEANRKSAAESRQRKKMLMEELQESVCLLREENAKLKLENSILKQKMILAQAAWLPPNPSVNSCLLNLHDSSGLLQRNNVLNNAVANAINPRDATSTLIGGTGAMNSNATMNALIPTGQVPGEIQKNVPETLYSPRSRPCTLSNQVNSLNAKNLASLLQNPLIQRAGSNQSLNPRSLSHPSLSARSLSNQSLNPRSMANQTWNTRAMANQSWNPRTLSNQTYNLSSLPNNAFPPLLPRSMSNQSFSTESQEQDLANRSHLPDF